MTLPQPFLFGERLRDGQALDEVLATPIWSYSKPLTATVGGTRTTSLRITETVANVATVGATGAGVTLPVALPGKVVMVCNNTTTDLRVFSNDPSTINGISGDTGILQPGPSVGFYIAQALREWVTAKLPTSASLLHYGSFYSDQIQTNTDNTARLIMTLNNTVATSPGISIVGGSQITVAYDGVYNIQFSAQMDKTDSGTDNVEIWLMVNGQNVSDSNTTLTMTNNNTKLVAAWNFVLPLNAGDYVQLAWFSADVGMRIFAQAAHAAVPGVSPARPAIPSLIVTVNSL
jgi:hypothetical protein